jgi:alpha-L-fucosidase
MDAARHQAALDPLLHTMQSVIDQGPFKLDDGSLDQHPAPEWYADAKLGIFMHWGLFSVPGFPGVGCWYGNNMYDPKSGAFAFHRTFFGPQDQFGYKDLARYFTAPAFDAEAWAQLYADAGARYIVPVSCFHDGFAMWDSKLTDWTAVKTGPKRDYDGLLAAAARRRGMKFGVAWHAFFRPGFFAPGRRPGTDIHPPDSGPPWSFYGPDKVDRDFLDDSMGRLVELVDGYRPDLVYFDFDTGFVPKEDLARFMCFYYNRAAQWGSGVAVNDKHEGLFPRSAVLDYERGKSGGLRPQLWQTDTSVSWRDWSYMRNDSFKTADELVHELVDIVSKNGVLLLDIGPRPDGTIPPEPQALLRAVGAWLKVNGEAIYATRPCWALGFGEGRHNSGGGGFSDSAQDYSAEDWRFTQKGGSVYAIAMDWPLTADHFLIRALGSSSTFATGGLSKVELLAGAEPLQWQATTEGLRIERPARRPCDTAYAFKLSYRGVELEKLTAEPAVGGHLAVELQLRNLDDQAVEQPLEFRLNDAAVGRRTFALAPNQTLTQRLTLEAPAAAGLAVLTANAPGAPPFAARAEIVAPPTAAAQTFDGATRLAGGGLGRREKLTITLWARAEAVDEDWTALLNTEGWGPGGLHLQFQRSGHLQVSFNADGHVTDWASTAAPALGRGWCLVTLTYDAAAKRFELFLNGRSEGPRPMDEAGPVNLEAFGLGGWNGARRLKGQLADVRIYDRVLSPEEIAALRGGAAPSQGLLANWAFGAAGLRDGSGGGHDLRVAN